MEAIKKGVKDMNFDDIRHYESANLMNHRVRNNHFKNLFFAIDLVTLAIDFVVEWGSKDTNPTIKTFSNLEDAAKFYEELNLDRKRNSYQSE